MKKVIMTLGVLLMMSASLIGCNNQSTVVKSNKDVVATLKSAKGFEADAGITFLKDKQPNTIKAHQQGKISGEYEMTIIEPKDLAGVKISYDNNQVVQTFPGQDKNIVAKPNNAQNEVLLTTYLKRLQAANSINKEEATLDGKKVYVIALPIEGDYKYLSSEKLFIDGEANKIISLVIYDKDGNESIEVNYDNLKLN